MAQVPYDAGTARRPAILCWDCHSKGSSQISIGSKILVYETSTVMSDSYVFGQHWDIRDGKSGHLRVGSHPDLIPVDVLSGNEQLVGLA